VISRNPFAKRRDKEPGKLIVMFLAADSTEENRAKVRNIKADPEEVRIDGRELYIYFPNGRDAPSFRCRPSLRRSVRDGKKLEHSSQVARDDRKGLVDL